MHFPFGVYHGATPRSHWAKQTLKKLNLWEKTVVGESRRYSCKVEIIWTKCLKKLITETFPQETTFNPTLGLHASPFTLHASNVNPTDYNLASLVDAGEWEMQKDGEWDFMRFSISYYVQLTQNGREI